MMQEVTLKQLLEAGCHFGHKADRWHPKAQEFIYQVREGIHIIDLVKTKAGLDAAAKFIYNTAKNGGTVLFVGTKRQAASVIKEQAAAVGAPYISQRWIGGFLTNWEQVHKNLEKIRQLTEDEQKGLWMKYPKHERMKLARYLARLNYFYGGVISLLSLPDAILVVDIKREEVAVREAKKMGVPVIGVVDTNSDPTPINYPIPANDDAVGSVRLLIETLAAAYKEGREMYQKNQKSNKPAVHTEVRENGKAAVTTASESEIKHPAQKTAGSIKKAPKSESEEEAETKTIEKKKQTEKELKNKAVEIPKKKPGRPKKLAS